MAICPNATETPLLDVVKEKTKVPVIANLKGQIEHELKLAQS